MKPKPKGPGLDDEVVFLIHDDDCPDPEGGPCNCTPTERTMTLREALKLIYNGGRPLTVGEAMGHGQWRH